MVRSHEQTRTTVRTALLFIVAAGIAGISGRSDWLALHLFLAGAVVLAISGMSLMLTVTWSAAPAPPNWSVRVQRICIAAGAAGVGVAREAGWPDAVVGVCGVVYVAGLVLLVGLLVFTARRGVVRRFDAAVAAYVAAVIAGIGGIGLGIWMATSSPSPTARAAHVTLNLLGLVGLVVGGTMPFFAATVARARMSPHATPTRLTVLLAWQVCALVLATTALVLDRAGPAAAGLAAYALGVVAVLVHMPRPTHRQLRWSGPRLIGLWAGGAWWVVAVAASATDAAAGRVVFADRWLFVLVIAGYAQILWGSLAYVLPVLRGGGHERLAEGFRATRSWVALAAANLAGVALVLSAPGLAVAAVVVWVGDAAWRFARVGTTRAPRPGAGAA